MDHARFRDLSECLHWIRATQLEIDRYVNSLRDLDWPTRHVSTAADAHFLLIAAAQVERTLKRLGRELPKERRQMLRWLRDVHEHWEQHKDSFASPTLPKRRSGKHFAQEYPDATPWVFKFDATGTWISELRLEDFWPELLAMEVEVEAEFAQMCEDHGLEHLATCLADAARPFPQPNELGISIAVIAQRLPNT